MTSGRIDTVRPDADIDEIMTLMKRDQVRRVPVVEDGDRLVGIVAQADLALDTGRSKRDEVAETVERISEPVGARR
jgi:CBS domain-containing protein